MATKVQRGAKSKRSASRTPMERLRSEAQRLIAKNGGDLRKNLERLQKQIQAGAERTIRDLERRLLRSLHAANEAQVKRLDQRVARLERALARMGAGAASPGERDS